MHSHDTLTAAAPRSAATFAWFAGGGGLLVVLMALSQMLAPETGRALTVNTVRLSLAWYLAAVLLMTRLDDAGWKCESACGRTARWCWTWGVVVFLVHLAMAFHFYHNWSHQHAFDHTRQVSGVGEGIYISYFFTLLWVADAFWWWMNPASYAARSAAPYAALHSFMLFIVFNGAVIFESGPIRIAGAMGTMAIVAAWMVSRCPRVFSRRAARRPAQRPAPARCERR